MQIGLRMSVCKHHVLVQVHAVESAPSLTASDVINTELHTIKTMCHGYASFAS